MAVIMHEGNPYVHSNIYSFHSQLNKELEAAKISKPDNKISKMISSLKKIRDDLATEAVNFVRSFGEEKSLNITANSVSGAYQAGQWLTNYSITKNSNDTFLEKCRKFGMETLREKDILNTITPATINLDKLKGVVSNEILKEIRKIASSDIDISELSKILAEKVREELQKGGTQQKYNIDAKGILVGASRKELNSLFSRQITLKSELIEKRIKQVLKPLAIQESKKKISPEQEIRSAGQKFLNRLRSKFSQEELLVHAQQYNDFSNQFLQELVYAYGKKGLSYDKSNLTGDLGEQFFAALTNASDGSLRIEVIATQNEEDMVKQGVAVTALGETIKVTQMKTHHSDKKMSQTDLIFISPSGKTVRVQSKNSLEVYQLIINEKNVPQTAKLQEEKLLKEFMSDLMEVPNSVFTQSEYDAISYLYANLMWFNTEGTYNEDNVRKRDNKNIGTSGLLGPMEEIEKNLSMGASSLLGVTLDSIITDENSSMIVSGSNIFYQFSNKVIVPTSIIFDNLIEFLKGVQNTQFQLRITGIKSSAKFGIDKDSLYRKKEEAVSSEGGFISNGGYQNSSLLLVGTEPGQSFMDNFKLSRINLRVDPSVIFNSSYIMNPNN